MTDKAYIVANEQQEMAVLRELEGQGCKWLDEFDKPTEFIPSVEFGSDMMEFPYVIFTEIEFNFGTTIYIEYDYLKGFDFSNTEIVFDGRKEEQMSEKYVVSQEFMNELEEWKDAYITDTLYEKYHYVSAGDLDKLPGMIKDWWIELNKPTETNNHLITIIRWVNGEDVFEVEKPKKWVVRSKKEAIKGHYSYVSLTKNKKDNVHLYDEFNATWFDTKEEAESWANAHQEVIEVEE